MASAQKYANYHTSGLEVNITGPTDNLRIELTWAGRANRGTRRVIFLPCLTRHHTVGNVRLRYCLNNKVPLMKKHVIAAALGVLCGCGCAADMAAGDDLAAGFSHPPQAARLRAYWWWLNGNVNKAAITRDLEWMKRIGMGGGLICDAGTPLDPPPPGPTYGSPKWRELFMHAVREADRLGLELSCTPQSGWNLGGPCVPPQDAAKHIAWSELQVVGPAKFAGALPLPEHREGFYRDTFVLAYPAKAPAGQRPRPIRQLAWKAAFHELGMSPSDCCALVGGRAGGARRGGRAGQGRGRPDRALRQTRHAALGRSRGYVAGPAIRLHRNGADVSTSSGKWQGLVVDYLDADALRAYWRRSGRADLG